MKKKNRLISIGYLGMFRCYLNISNTEAIERYIESENITREQYEADGDIDLYAFEFDDEFGAYSVCE